MLVTYIAVLFIIARFIHAGKTRRVSKRKHVVIQQTFTTAFTQSQLEHHLMDESTANEGNLNIARYVQRQQEEESISVPDALATLQEKLAIQEQKESRVAELFERERLAPSSV